jgi:YidC/Oxa1 family membrane protein insertase
MLLTANIFQPLITVFEAVLKFFHNNVGVGWGLSIVLLTILIRALLIPLTLKQFSSMRKLQQLQPELKAIQQRYKDDKQRQQQELMKFYKENQVNPLGSCLPLVAQLPVFISLFYMLRKDLRDNICPSVQDAFRAHYASLHHISAHAAAGQTTPCGKAPGAGFLFISDLTDKATGATLVVLILLYVGTQLGSSLMMMSSNATMDKTQRNLMLFMPLIFVFIMIGFPAGVLLYWITTNGWTILQQFIVKRRIGPAPALATAGGPSGGAGPPGGGRGGGGGGGPRGGNGGPPNGSDNEGGLGGLLKGRLKPSEEKKEPAGVGARRGASGPPPRPPRKKKKRSGRRR